MGLLKQGDVTAALFLTQAEAEEKYKVIKETLLQLNVSTAERKKKKNRWDPLVGFVFG